MKGTNGIHIEVSVSSRGIAVSLKSHGMVVQACLLQPLMIHMRYNEIKTFFHTREVRLNTF